MNAIKNHSLDRELNNLLRNFKNIEVSKGNVGGNSIEVHDKSENSFNSYLYKNDSNKRDEDYETLLELLEEKYEESETIKL